jgi:cell division septum initiation protein DivIVA
MTSDPDQIRAGIEQTHRELSADVDALTEKVSPPRIMERRVQRTRSAFTNVKDRIMGSAAERTSGMGGTVSSAGSSAKDTLSSAASSMTGTASSAASSVADTASSAPDMARRRTQGNPLAAGLVAFGAGWLLSSLLPATEPEQQMASQVKDLATEKGRPVAEQLGQAGQQAAQELRESAQQRAQSVKETASDAASTVAEEAQSRATEVTGHAEEARDRFTDQARPSGS